MRLATRAPAARAARAMLPMPQHGRTFLTAAAYNLAKKQVRPRDPYCPPSHTAPRTIFPVSSSLCFLLPSLDNKKGSRSCTMASLTQHRLTLLTPSAHFRPRRCPR